MVFYAPKLNGADEMTFVDGFCGAGGSSLGLTQAGWKLKVALNHWKRAIATHSANFPNAEHVCEDINAYDMRRLPAARCAWFSPICTEASPAGGTKADTAQMELLRALALEGATDRINAMERTRATFMDVIRATELWRYEAVLIENVPNVASKWALFDWWVEGMKLLGYNVQYVSVSSAHVGGDSNPYAPQWRDRLYLVFTRVGIPLPDVEPRPLAHCFTCGQDVRARQAWTKPMARHIGKYGRNGQYRYVCPDPSCRGAQVEPYVMPASSAIDWSDLGQRIGDRDRPLQPATVRRIQVGIDQLWDPTIVQVGGNTYERPGSGYTRAWPAATAPLNARTGTPGDGVATPPQPFIAELRGGGSKNVVRPVAHPLATVTGQGNHHALATPPGAFVQKHHGGVDYPYPGHMCKPVAEPFGTVVGKPNMSLVIPYRRGERPHMADGAPLSTVCGTQQHGLVPDAWPTVEDCHFRMLKWPEHAAAQRLYFKAQGDYTFTGTGTERTLQAGNAVSSNVAQWLGEQVAAALNGRAESVA